MQKAAAHAYRTGDLVRVRSAGEILATLDSRGTYEELPFMPEMLPYIGKTLRVSAAVQKLCWHTHESSSRKMDSTVILDQLRCSGEGHAGCAAECRLYWKEAWLRPATAADAEGDPGIESPEMAELARVSNANTRELRAFNGVDEEVYRCQYTDLVRASEPIGELEPSQYVGELRSRNISVWRFVTVFLRAFWWRVSRRLLKRVPEMPKVAGSERVDGERLDLRPGEIVQVRSLDEVGRTLDEESRHRGLTWTQELTPRCGKRFRVRARVDRLIDRETGRMIELKNDCIALDGVVCSGDRTPGAWFCPAEHYTLWREAWLSRVEDSARS
ncbi:MAG TPA: hypothetical protein VFO26_10850 [Gaiella sp.]|uniref:hypothetical protein n=1 Tax=Gaiella sp. TaxID=2663207 RepID=UPI002D7EAC6D|nr:hypothetical protein [Gaiella sp.]HET9288049.1 hypothetical protein [Gaiella sp.]